jgi:hypothetical protein
MQNAVQAWVIATVYIIELFIHIFYSPDVDMLNGIKYAVQVMLQTVVIIVAALVMTGSINFDAGQNLCIQISVAQVFMAIPEQILGIMFFAVLDRTGPPRDPDFKTTEKELALARERHALTLRQKVAALKLVLTQLKEWKPLLKAGDTVGILVDIVADRALIRSLKILREGCVCTLFDSIFSSSDVREALRLEASGRPDIASPVQALNEAKWDTSLAFDAAISHLFCIQDTLDGPCSDPRPPSPARDARSDAAACGANLGSGEHTHLDPSRTVVSPSNAGAAACGANFGFGGEDAADIDRAYSLDPWELRAFRQSDADRLAESQPPHPIYSTAVGQSQSEPVVNFALDRSLSLRPPGPPGLHPFRGLTGAFALDFGGVVQPPFPDACEHGAAPSPLEACRGEGAKAAKGSRAGLTRQASEGPAGQADRRFPPALADSQLVFLVPQAACVRPGPERSASRLETVWSPTGPEGGAGKLETVWSPQQGRTDAAEPAKLEQLLEPLLEPLLELSPGSGPWAPGPGLLVHSESPATAGGSAPSFRPMVAR